MTTLYRWMLALAVIGFATGLKAQEYTFVVEPGYPPDRAQEVYRPLVEYLAKATGYRFKLVTPRNYHFHWRDVRNNKPVDFAFEEAHLVDYRINRHGFVPLARTAERTSYTLLADVDRAERGLDGLVGYRVISMPSPSLGSALLMKLYRNPLNQPDIRSEASSWRDGVEMVFSGEAEGAIVPTFLAQTYPNLVAVQTTEEFAGPCVTASSEVDPAVREAVKTALLQMHEDDSLYEVLVEVGASRFEAASASEYRGAERMLEGFFGYQAR
jgi:hypothetical protein